MLSKIGYISVFSLGAFKTNAFFTKPTIINKKGSVFDLMMPWKW
jgi:hypothetical protein